MGRHAEWEVVTKNNGIVMIRDLERSGCMSITNDAEYVFVALQRNRLTHKLNRVIYQQQDSNSEWWEIVGTYHRNDEWRISFKPWHGEVWDRLTKTY